MDPTTTPIAVERHVVVDAEPDEVWEAVTEPDALGGWLGGEVDLDPVPGGVGRFDLGEDGAFSVLVTAAEAPSRLAMLWWPAEGEAAPSSVEITLQPVDAGTLVQVREWSTAGTIECRAAIGARSPRALRAAGPVLVARR